MTHVTDWLSTFLHAAGLGHRSCSFAQLRIYHLIVDRLHAVGLRHLFVFDHCQSSGWQRFSESPSLNNRRSCSQYLCIFIYLYFHMSFFSYVYIFICLSSSFNSITAGCAVNIYVYLYIYIFMFSYVYLFICLYFHYVYLLPFNSRRSCSQSKGGHCPLHRPGESFFYCRLENIKNILWFQNNTKIYGKWF